MYVYLFFHADDGIRDGDRCLEFSGVIFGSWCVGVEREREGVLGGRERWCVGVERERDGVLGWRERGWRGREGERGGGGGGRERGCVGVGWG